MIEREFKQGDVVALGANHPCLPKGFALRVCRKVRNSDRYVVAAVDGSALPGGHDGTAIIDAKFFARPLDPEKLRAAAAAIMVAKVGGPEWLGEDEAKFVKRNEKYESPMWVEAFGLAKVALEAAR
jgi:hypothetical protein